jgi:hypothetical protein
MEVDRAPTLVLGHLGIGDPDQPTQPGLVQADQAAQGTLDGDGGPPPQLRGQGVPEHLRLGVVAGRTQWLPQPRVIHVMAMPAASPLAVRAAGTLAVRMAGQDQPPLGLARVDPAEAGGGEGDEQPRMGGHRLGDALAALQAGLLVPHDLPRGTVRAMAEHGHVEIGYRDEITTRMPDPQPQTPHQPTRHPSRPMADSLDPWPTSFALSLALVAWWHATASTVPPGPRAGQSVRTGNRRAAP